MKDEQLTPLKALLWIVCLAFLSVGARNFEPGISLDGPLFATIARNMAETGNWFLMDGSVPDFRPGYAEHPHLGYWVLVPFFKVLPIADWSARIPGHLFYVAFMWLFFLYVRRTADQKVAVWSIVLLWSWYQFSNPFSNVYLDPGALFTAMASIVLFDLSLERRSPWLGAASGGLLGLSALYKGLTFLGFFPVLAYLLGLSFYQNRKFTDALKTALPFAISLVLVVLAYLVLLRFTSGAYFFEVYWSRQMTNRFNQIRSFSNLFHWPYWQNLLRYTYYLAPLALLALLRWREGKRIVLPFVFLSTFIVMFCTVQLVGGQYLLMVMPGIAWLIGEKFSQWIPVPSIRLVKFTAVVAILGVFLVQYLPIPTHAAKVSQDMRVISRLAHSQGKKRLTLDVAIYPTPPWPVAASYAWYGHISTYYYHTTNEIPVATSDQLYLLYPTTTERTKRLKNKGWCLHSSYGPRTLWTDCVAN